MKVMTIKIGRKRKETKEERKRRVQNDVVNKHTVFRDRTKYNRKDYKNPSHW